MRAILLDWIVDVHYSFKLRQETLHLTVEIIDLYLQETTRKKELVLKKYL